MRLFGGEEEKRGSGHPQADKTYVTGGGIDLLQTSQDARVCVWRRNRIDERNGLCRKKKRGNARTKNVVILKKTKTVHGDPKKKKGGEKVIL